MNKVEKRKYEGKCYSFAVEFVTDWQLKKGPFNPDQVKALSHELSGEIQILIEEFFRGRSK